MRLFIQLVVVLTTLACGTGLAHAATTLNFFQPADSSGRVGFLALNNTGTSPANVTLAGVDDKGVKAPGGNITLTLAAGQSRYLSSQDIENGKSSVMTGAFGNGAGYWHIDITATGGITAQNFIYTPDGALTELTTPLTAESDGSYFVKFFTEPNASVFGARLRLRNLTGTAGTVTITAKSAAGTAISGSATVALPASNAVEISSQDLKGSTAAGVSGGLGAGDGFWILKLVSTVSVHAQALAQSAGGTLADIGRGLAVTASAPAATCGSANFLAVKADSHNTAYAAPTLTVNCGATSMTVQSNGIPTFEFVQTTPNRLQAVAATYRIPITPTVSSNPESIPLAGPAAVTVAGLPIFGPTESKQDGYRDPYKDALLDFCAGHTAQRGDYHHHFRPDCLFANGTTNKVGLVVGYAFDGYPILAPYECTDASCGTVYKVKSSWKYTGGSTAAWSSNTYVAGSGNLDKCNGMTRPDGSYAYYATDEFPYFMGCYHGVADSSNIVPQTP